MALHFSETELKARRDDSARELARRGLAGLLIFRQETMYYLSGYDTFGYCFFQCLYLGADGRMTLLTRAPDLRQARHTSVIEDIRVWTDQAGGEPAVALRDILAEHGCRGALLGIEYDAYGLTAQNWRRVEAALTGFCALEDASDLISRLRAVKSPAEMVYVRRAAALADDALDAALPLVRPGAFEGDILAAMQGAVFRGGGDYPGNEFIIGSGRDALLCRYFTGRRSLAEKDQLTLEFAGAYRRYHACLMRTVLVGAADPGHRDMHRACADALRACKEALKPGRPVGEVFEAHARVMDEAGYRDHRMNACGYSLGATYTPTWMDWPMFYTGNSVPAQPNMVFFLHMILMNSDSGRAMTLGQTVVVTETGCEPLSRASLDLVVM
ncbi:MAG: aminopeptidase P family protein [Gammaproteobacteria bacterium]|nr:aminopeptidase P family protein [Gammaproteobacteria bacterium]NIR81677.1 aminopeptidase P family protein [Gammaproteobacteria bacterium]NIR88240.1 aminopeptidase P family protein [Gammaproteobacteria bacterium]NIU02779.1 aminopeptidase P family protein [Gammaproteobacteria bacterium]NIV50303.1 M24 family metallopeptidase [Gammaproteobacteria bacterium]